MYGFIEDKGSTPGAAHHVMDLSREHLHVDSLMLFASVEAQFFFCCPTIHTLSYVPNVFPTLLVPFFMPNSPGDSPPGG
jgi:hypothetical protein